MKSMCIQRMLLLLMLALAACGTPAAPSAGVPATAAATPASPAAAVGVPQSTLSAQHATEEARLLMTTPSVASPTSQANCTVPPNADKSNVQLGGPNFCVVWNDNYTDERGFRVVLAYPRLSERLVYDIDAHTTAFVIPASDRPSAEKAPCQRSLYILEVYAILPNEDALVGSLAVEAECRPEPSSVITAPAAPTAITLIDPQQPLASADAPAWQFQRSATADFDGDGVEETAFIIADAVVENGRALWDDGHRWQVYIEEPDGTRTYVYARFLPNGKLEALLSGPIGAPIPTITLLERTPFTLALYELRYRGPQQVEAVELVQRELDPRRFFEGTPE